ncbi:hypothetical protein LTR86_002077 [Recurvomyces mirabilis]|nr:hypothetical protein LTR86_002077 [Recurvomyces mirabilis]
MHSMQEAPHVSRFSSQSTGTTLIGSENGTYSPVSPLFAESQTPFLGAYPQNVPYTGQWFYLNQVPPKLLRELQRQCDSAEGKDKTNLWAKNAAKLKAWARPTKRGVDIRLRQRVDTGRDEVTDIRLEKYDHMELPVTGPSELGDTSIVQELESPAGEIRALSPAPSDATVSTLPRYEPGNFLVSPLPVLTGSDEPAVSLRGRMHQRSTSSLSIIPTPKRGLSVAEVERSAPAVPADEGDKSQKKYEKKPIQELRPSLQAMTDELEKERQAREICEALLKDAEAELSRRQSDRERHPAPHLKVAQAARYETDTDVDPPSPSARRKRETRSAHGGLSNEAKKKKRDMLNRGAKQKTGQALGRGKLVTIQAGAEYTEPTTSGEVGQGLTETKSLPVSPGGKKTDSDQSRSAHARSTSAEQKHIVATAEGISGPSTSQADEHLNAQRQKLPLITTSFHPATRDPSPVEQNAVYGTVDPWYTPRPPHKTYGALSSFVGPALSAMANASINGIRWFQRNYGPEPALEAEKVRVRWTCRCGRQLYDDFVEKRAGAARELEAYLNRPVVMASPTTPSTAHSNRPFSPNSSLGMPPSSQTSMSSLGMSRGSPIGNGKTKPSRTSTDLPAYRPFDFPAEPPWLLTCATEDRHTPKLAHLDMGSQKIRSDKDLAMSLRNHYFSVNNKWWRIFRLRGLVTINFVQFEVHQNRFADIRKCPDVPIAGHTEYEFVPGDLLPPVGSHYLLHLFRHPEDYDGELITYLRAPKKNGRLQLGVGWGIDLVEGFEASKVWLASSLFFGLGSFVFAVAWAWKKQDIQGAFGVAAWICTLAGLLLGWMQASIG